MKEESNFKVQFNAANTAADANADAAGASARRVFSGWKRFLADGAVWLLIVLTARGVWSAGTFTARQVRRFQRLIEWSETLPFGGDDRARPFDRFRRKSRRPLEAWIAANLPRDRRGASAAADAMRGVAGLLRAGDLRGAEDAMAELTARLTPELDRARWRPFLGELSDRLLDELDAADPADAAALADLLDRAADAFSTRAARADTEAAADDGENEDAPAKESAPAENSPAAPARACPAGNCAAGYGYRYFF